MDLLLKEVASLRSEFQHLADSRPWIRAIVPQLHQVGQVHFGVPDADSEFPTDLHDAIGHASPIEVRVLDHASALTHRAESVVLDAMESVPDDIAQEMLDWEERRAGYSWIRWVWYATAMHHVFVIDNYAQAAATALMELERLLRPRKPRRKTAQKQGRGRPAGTKTAERDRKLYEDWKASRQSDGTTKREFVRAKGLSDSAVDAIERGRKQASKKSGKK